MRESGYDQGTLKPTLKQRVLRGAAIAAVLQFIFFSFVVNRALWPLNRIIFVAVAVLLAGASGGALYYYLDPMREKGGASKIVANVLSILVYCLMLVTAFFLAMNYYEQLSLF